MSILNSLLGAGLNLIGGQLGANETANAGPTRQDQRGTQSRQGTGTQSRQGTGTQARQGTGTENLTNVFQAFPGLSSPFNVSGPGGGAQFNGQDISQFLSPEFAQQLGLFSRIAGQPGGGFGNLDDSINRFTRLLMNERQRSRGRVEDRRLDVLRDRARPFEDELRQQTRAQVFNQGRLGLGQRGTLTGQSSNPELAALEEGLARADLGRQESASEFARQRRSDRIGEVQGILSSLLGVGTQGLQNRLGASQGALNLLGPGMASAQLGLGARTPLQNLATNRDMTRGFSESGESGFDQSGATGFDEFGDFTRYGMTSDPRFAAAQRGRSIEDFFSDIGGFFEEGGVFGEQQRPTPGRG